jgi:hypothetical protein
MSVADDRAKSYISNFTPDLAQLNLSRPEDYAVWWLETEGVFTGLSSSIDLKRQLAFHLGKYPRYKDTPSFLDMTFKELSRLIFHKKLPRKRLQTLPKLGLIRDKSSRRDNDAFNVAVVLPFHAQEILKIDHMMASWDDFPPCSHHNQVSSFQAGDQQVLLHFVWAYALDFQQEQGKVVKETLEWLWNRHTNATKCFASSTFLSLKQDPAIDHYTGACTTFYQLMGYLGDGFDAMQLFETDVRPIRANWLEAMSIFVSPKSSCTEWWIKGSPSMCSTEYDDIDAGHDMHINGNALYVLNCPDFDDYLRRVQLFYSDTGKGKVLAVAGRQGGYDKAMYQYLQEPENHVYSRRITGKFVHSSFLVNMCEDIYSPKALAEKINGVYLVHSKSVFLGDASKNIYRILNSHYENRPVPFMFKRALPLFRSGELDKDNFASTITSKRKRDSRLPVGVKSWEKAYEGKVYLWSLDFHAGPVSCNLVIYREAGAVIHAEVDSFTCKFCGLCPKRQRILREDHYRGISLETGGLRAQQLIQQYFHRYQKDPEHLRVDAFICSHPTANCQLYLPFKKPIIVYATTRLEFGRHDKGVFWRLPYWTQEKGEAAWQQWLTDLHEISKHPGSVIAANNMYDVHYIKYFTGIDARYIPTWCGDQAEDYRLAMEGKMPYVGLLSYHPSKATVLVGPYRTNLNLARDGSHTIEKESTHPIALQLKAAAHAKEGRKSGNHTNFNIEFMSDLARSNFNNMEFCTYLAIICLPYQVSTISIMEYYRLNIPLFFPSITLLKEWKQQYGILWERIYGWPERIPSFILGEPIQAPDPNDDTDEAFDYWMQFSDWLVLPHIQIFDSFEHLMELLGSLDLFEISDRMREYNAAEREMIVAEWKVIFNEIKNVRGRIS